MLMIDQIYDEKVAWSVEKSIDNENPEYLQHKKRQQELREQTAKTRVQVE